MRGQQVNQICGRLLIAFSMIALLTVLTGFLQPPHPPDADEGTAAHIFQLSIAAFALALLFFLPTSDWRRPGQSARPLAIPVTAVILAFGLLYYFEHYRWR